MEKQRSYKAHASTVKGVEKYLNKRGIAYLDYASFSQSHPE